ncbi:MAG: TIGR00730 family Rossman fold protein [Elusimicrobia bacterium]|nr:TIGR00730 family Rossman fold protein [Elusimicrobiota bacterium]
MRRAALLLLFALPAYANNKTVAPVQLPATVAMPLAGAAAATAASLTRGALANPLSLPAVLPVVNPSVRPGLSGALGATAGTIRYADGIMRPVAGATPLAVAGALDRMYDGKAAGTGAPESHARFLRELDAPAEVLGQNGITRTIAIYGSARLLPAEAAAGKLAAARAASAADRGNRELRSAAVAAAEDVRMSKWYEATRRFAARVSVITLGMVAIVTGGGPGAMEAANRGASEAGGPSVGFNIRLPHEQGLNDYVTPGLSYEFHEFPTRKRGIGYAADAHVFVPGGFGTLEELFSVLTPMQTGLIPRAPIVLLGGREYWGKVINFRELVKTRMISPADMKLIYFVDTEEEAWRAIAKHYADQPEYAGAAKRRHEGAGIFQPVFQALQQARVRHVVVGGHAVRFHGMPRATPDLDLVIDLEPAAARRAISALLGLGLKPRVPVDPLSFADSETRRQWIEEKNMMVFTFSDPKDPLLSVDLFVKAPIPFEELFARSEVHDVGGTGVRVASAGHLRQMKLKAGRPQDLRDARFLADVAED